MGKRKILTARGPHAGFETTRIVLPREVQTREHRLFYVEAGMGAPLLLIHGLGGSSRWWFHLFPGLTSASFRLIAPDLPGFGRSRGAFVEIPRAAKAVVELADRAGLDQFFACGHSLGGAIAAQMAADYKGRVRRLVLVNSAGIPGIGLGSWLARAAQPWSWCPLGFMSTMLGDIIRAGPRNMLAGARHLQRYDLRPALERIADLPTLVIWGAKDTLTPTSHGERIVSGLKRGRLELVEGARHLPMVSHADAVARTIAAFLSAGLKGRRELD